MGDLQVLRSLSLVRPLDERRIRTAAELRADAGEEAEESPEVPK